MANPEPSPPNSSIEDKPQTDAKTPGIENQVRETFFHGVRDMTMKNPTFIQNIHGGKPGKVVDSIKTGIIVDCIFQTLNLMT